MLHLCIVIGLFELSVYIDLKLRTPNFMVFQAMVTFDEDRSNLDIVRITRLDPLPGSVPILKSIRDFKT